MFVFFSVDHTLVQEVVLESEASVTDVEIVAVVRPVVGVITVDQGHRNLEIGEMRRTDDPVRLIEYNEQLQTFS